MRRTLVSYKKEPYLMADEKKSEISSNKKELNMADEKKDVKVESEDINIKVLGQDNAVMKIKMKKHTPLSNLMIAYCDRVGTAMATTRFRFDGHPINETDTPISLEMEEGDTIEVYQQQTGGTSSITIC